MAASFWSYAPHHVSLRIESAMRSRVQNARAKALPPPVRLAAAASRSSRSTQLKGAEGGGGGGAGGGGEGGGEGGGGEGGGEGGGAGGGLGA